MQIETAYGVIVVFKEEEFKFLVLQQEDIHDTNWSFPKGHAETGEDPKTTALRELEEETAIAEISLLDIPLIHEEYNILRGDEKRLKINEYFIGIVIDKSVVIQEKEIRSYKWFTYEKALQIFTQSERKEVLQKAKEYLDTYESRK